ncbi:MAG: cadherin-like beta sandwich domain-containing protein [Lachnospiraceae bacterium]|nr:cadherin-like beta sandwich domain-containing protein [Lachnospiraceae bacterium]
MKGPARMLVLTVCPLLFFILAFSNIQAHASSADITISSDSDIYHKGDTVSISIEIEADVIPGDFEGYLLYPEDVLTYVSGPGVVSGGEGILKISDQVETETKTSRKYALKFKATGLGNAEISLREDPELYEYEEGYLMSVSSNVLRLSVTASAKDSSDASLAVLKVSPGTLTPAFDTDVTEYEVKVPEGTGKLVVSAAASDMDAVVDVKGNESLVSGTNRIEIKVTAPDGSTKLYVIKCEYGEKKEDPIDDPQTTDIPVSTEPVPTEPGVKNGISAVQKGEEIHLLCDNEFVVTEPDESIIIPEGYEKTYLKIDGLSIPVYASKDEGKDSFLLIVIKDNNGAPVLYSYDRAEKTLQRYKEKSTKQTGMVLTESIEALELAQSYEKSLNTLTIIIAVLSGLTLALLIIVISLSVKNKNDEL